MDDIAPLVKGIISIIGIALALGQYPKLEHWAREQAIEAMKWKQDLPDLFPEAELHGQRINYLAHMPDQSRRFKKSKVQ